MDQSLRLRGTEHLQGWRAYVLVLLAFAAIWLVLNPVLATLELFQIKFSWPPSPVLAAVLFTIPAGALVVGFACIAVVRCRIHLDDSGIRYESGWPAAIAKHLDWSFRWAEVRGVSVRGGLDSTPLARTLRIDVRGRSVRVTPWHWDLEEGSSLLMSAQEIHRADRATLVRLWEETPIVRRFVAQGFGEAALKPVPASSEAQSSVQGASIAILFATLVFYAILDIYFGLDEFYAGGAPLFGFITLGACGAGLGYWCFPPDLRGQRDARLMALLLGFSVSLASYPLLLRINEWTDVGGLNTVTYELGDRGIWSAVEGAGPPLVFDIGTGYWSQFQPGDRKTFELRFGGLGFHQINMLPIYAEQREYYRVK